jgi:hypothetical protein
MRVHIFEGNNQNPARTGILQDQSLCRIFNKVKHTQHTLFVTSVLHLLKKLGSHILQTHGCIPRPATLMQDPSGYLWEVEPALENGMEPFRELDILVSDIDASERFYVDALGMTVVGRENDDESFRVWRLLTNLGTLVLKTMQPWPNHQCL